MAGHHAAKGVKKYLPEIAIGVAIAVYLLLSFAGLSSLGLAYDETAFVNGALGGITDDLIYMRIFGIPVMTFVYDGALKAWLYYPIFKIFGVSLYTLRIPGIFISLCTILIWFRNSRFLFPGTLYSLVLLFLMATDPAFINHSKFEYNIFVLQSLLVAASFFFYWRYMENSSPRNLALFYLILIVGVFNKLNFLWLVGSLITTGVLFQHKVIIRAAKKHLQATIWLSLLFAAVMGLIVITLVLPAMNFPMGGKITQMLLIHKIAYVYKLFFLTLNGEYPYISFFQHHTYTIPIVSLIETGTTILALLTIPLARLLPPKNKHFYTYRKHLLFCLTVLFLLLAAIVITPQARHSYHLLITWPLNHVIFLLSVAMLSSFLYAKAGKALLWILAIILVCSQLSVNNLYLSALNNKYTNINFDWNPTISKLSNYVNQHADQYDSIVSLQFGTQHQLFALAPNNDIRKKIYDHAWYLLTDIEMIKTIRNKMYPQFNRSDSENAEWLYENVFRGKKSLLIYAPYYAESFRSKYFFEFAKKYHLQLDEIDKIYSDNGQLIYVIYTAKDNNR